MSEETINPASPQKTAGVLEGETDSMALTQRLNVEKGEDTLRFEHLERGNIPWNGLSDRARLGLEEHKNP